MLSHNLQEKLLFFIPVWFSFAYFYLRFIYFLVTLYWMFTFFLLTVYLLFTYFFTNVLYVFLTFISVILCFVFFLVSFTFFTYVFSCPRRGPLHSLSEQLNQPSKSVILWGFFPGFPAVPGMVRRLWGFFQDFHRISLAPHIFSIGFPLSRTFFQ